MSSDAEHLQWIHDRLIQVHGENPNYDYMIRMRECIQMVNIREKQLTNLRNRLSTIFNQADQIIGEVKKGSLNSDGTNPTDEFKRR